MKYEDRTPHWWSVFNAALTGLACGGGCASVVDEVIEMTDYALGEGPPKLAELPGIVRSISKTKAGIDAVVVVGETNLSVNVPSNQNLQPGDKVLCTIIVQRREGSSA